MMHSVLLVVPLLPDAATMAWVERELAKATWRTREAILKTLVYLAPVDAPRVANIYRKSVGLTRVNGAHVLEQPALGGLMDHYAIEWSLAGEDGYKSLLKENPEAFFPSPLFMVTVLDSVLSIFSCCFVRSPQVIDTPESCGACSGYKSLR